MPYLLNQAAEATSRSFQAIYAERYGMTRTQWRVLANLGKFGAMTAKNICDVSHIDKTKVSRAIAALEASKLLRRATDKKDRRSELLSLTASGRKTFSDLGCSAVEFDDNVRLSLGATEAARLEACLRALIKVQRSGTTSKE